MSFFLKQAINTLTAETSDLQALLDMKAVASQTYTMTEVSKKFTDLIDAAPAALDALHELSTALNNDANFAGTVVTALSDKAPKASPTFTGVATFADTKGLTKAMVRLSAVENTADKDKVISDNTAAALKLLAPIDAPKFTGTATFVGTQG